MSDAVMTVPVDFGGPQRRALRSAARKAGINVIQFVHEPAAALYAYLRGGSNFRRALSMLENRNVLVFDWGGGTLDLSLCHIAGGVLGQISSRGNNEVGGDRFDERLRNLIRDKHAVQHGVADLIAVEQPGAAAALLTQCELAKIELSNKNSHTVLVRDYLRGSGAERNLATEISRTELETVTQDIIHRGLQEIDKILEEARFDRRDIEICLATGGMVNMPAVWNGLVERFGGRVPKLSNGDRIIAEGAAWIARDGLRLMLSKPIEVIIADGSGKGAYLPLAPAGLKMPVENEIISVDNRRFFCVDPRDGAAVFEFTKPRKAGLVQASDERETVCVGSLPVDPEVIPLLERLECQLQIDHDYVAQATLKSLGRGEIARVEFHQLDFGLALPTQGQSEESAQPTSNENGGQSRASIIPHSRAAAQERSNVTLRSNISVKNNDWRAVPGDLIHKWRPSFMDVRSQEISQMQRDERNYYLPCSRCGRTLYRIRSEGPNEVCRNHRCSEFRPDA